MNIEDKVRADITRSKIMNNKWVGELLHISNDPTCGMIGKMDVKVAVFTEYNQYTEKKEWVGRLLVRTNQICFNDKTIFTLETMDREAKDFGKSTFRNILMRGLFMIDAHRGQNY